MQYLRGFWDKMFLQVRFIPVWYTASIWYKLKLLIYIGKNIVEQLYSLITTVHYLLLYFLYFIACIDDVYLDIQTEKLLFSFCCWSIGPANWQKVWRAGNNENHILETARVDPLEFQSIWHHYQQGDIYNREVTCSLWLCSISTSEVSISEKYVVCM